MSQVIIFAVMCQIMLKSAIYIEFSTHVSNLYISSKIRFSYQFIKSYNELFLDMALMIIKRLLFTLLVPK